ncbi:MAG: exo-alpha-sialidase [Bacteroidetes bacterium]|nr:exo-alpha-sialidase [Bacteroidota bacterium]
MFTSGYTQWQTDVRLTSNSGISSTSYNNARTIAAEGNHIYAVWHDDRDGNWEIYYKHSSDLGNTWGTDTRLTNFQEYSYYPSIAVFGPKVYVVWEDNRDYSSEIYYKYSTDYGSVWSPDIRLTNDSSFSIYPVIAASGQVVNVFWADRRDGNYEIYYKRSVDGGLTWGADTRLTNASENSGFVSTTFSGGFLYITWMDNRDGNYEIYFKRSTDIGVSWDSDIKLCNNSASSVYPSISAFNQNVYVVWQDNRDTNNEIYYSKSTNNGVDWGIEQRLSYNFRESKYPSIVVSGEILHLIWQDDRDYNYEIYYKRSTDNGATWTTDLRLTNDSGESRCPSVAVSGTSVHILWTDYRYGNYDVFYKRNPSGNSVRINNINIILPSTFELYQNFPNPFNPVTKIRFDIPENGKWKSENGVVTLKVYGILGKEAATLVNESLQPGSYETTWDASGNTSGIYFCVMKYGNEILRTRKMILLK